MFFFVLFFASRVYFLILWIKTKSNRSHRGFLPTPQWIILTTPGSVCPYSGGYWFGFIQSPVLCSSRASLPCTHIPVPAPVRPATALLQSFVPGAAVCPPVPFTPTFCSFFLSCGILLSYSSPEWCHTAPHPWNKSGPRRTLKKNSPPTCLCNWTLTGTHRPKLLECRDEGELIGVDVVFIKWHQVPHPQTSPWAWGSSWAPSTDCALQQSQRLLWWPWGV